MTRFLLLLSMALVISAPAMAEDKAAKKEEAPAEKVESVLKTKPAPKEENTPIKKWIDAENAVIDKLSDTDKESFLLLREKHSYIRTIQIVEKDIGTAVEACGKNNPDMKETMEGRFTQWKAAVNPVLDTAQKTLDKDIDNQKIVAAKDFRKVLKLQDEAHAFSEKNVTKKPVTSKEACEGLLESMDRTEDKMISLLQETLLPESALRLKYERAKKAEAESVEKAKPRN